MLIEDFNGNWWNSNYVIKYYIDSYNNVRLETETEGALLYQAVTKAQAIEWLEDFCIICNVQELSKHDKVQHNTNKPET
jgi:hypothetical protein